MNICIDITKKKKRLKYMKFFIFLSQVFIFWNRYMIALLSMLAATYFSMYTAKQSLNYWSPIQLQYIANWHHPKKKKKPLKYLKFLNFLSQVFIFWNCCIITLLSMLAATSFSMYTSSYIFFNVHCQTIIKLLISHSITHILLK